MAKTTTNSAGTGQAEISVFAFSIKGDATVVQTALHTLAKQGVSFQPPPSSLTPRPPAVSLPAASPNGNGVAAPAPQELPNADPQNVEPMVEASPPPPTPSSPKRRRTFSPVEPLDSLNVNDAPMPFHEFVKGRSIDGAIERGLVAATWVRDHRQTRQFGKRHIATAFKAMHWPMPEDPGSLLRNMKKAGSPTLTSGTTPTN
jgi:hypothetical protein